MLRFFDFDRTLCMHSYPDNYARVRGDYYMDALYELQRQVELHKFDKPLPCMQWYAKKCHEKGDTLFCLTHEIFNLRDEYKQEFLKEHYADTPMKYITVDSPEHKIDMIRALAEVHKVSLFNCELIEDNMCTVNLAIQNGITGTHISNIVTMYENMLAPRKDM